MSRRGRKRARTAAEEARAPRPRPAAPRPPSRSELKNAEARAAAAKLVDEGRKAIEIEKKSLRTELFARADNLARDIAGRVLGREIT